MAKAWNNQQIKKPCATCGRLMLLSPSLDDRKHCSKECQFKNNRVSLVCKNCSQPLQVNAFRARNRKHVFCGFACRCEFFQKRVAVQCAHCGIPVKRKLSQFKRHAIHFCCQKCSHEHFTEHRHPMWVAGLNYGREWRPITCIVRARDKVCQRCHKTARQNGRALDVHHRIPFSKFGYWRRMEAHRMSNLVSLCRRCHKFVEENGVAI